MPLKSVRSSSHRLVFCIVLDLSNLNQLSEICSNFLKFREAFIHNSINADYMFVCNKYDKFSSSPNEIKKVVNTYLRVIAKIINAPLIQEFFFLRSYRSQKDFTNQKRLAMIKRVDSTRVAPLGNCIPCWDEYDLMCPSLSKFCQYSFPKYIFRSRTNQNHQC